MENQTTPTGTPASAAQGTMQEVLPNSTVILVLGILSIVICCVVGFILAIIALVLANKGKALYDANPGKYTLSSFNNMKAGKICAIIGLILSLLVSLYYLIVVAILGTALSWPWHMYQF
jgi:hypothetical protein